MYFIQNYTSSLIKKIIFNIHHFKNLTTLNIEVLNNHFKQTQKITSVACGISLMAVRRVCRRLLQQQY